MNMVMLDTTASRRPTSRKRERIWTAAVYRGGDYTIVLLSGRSFADAVERAFDSLGAAAGMPRPARADWEVTSRGRDDERIHVRLTDAAGRESRAFIQVCAKERVARYRPADRGVVFSSYANLSA